MKREEGGRGKREEEERGMKREEGGIYNCLHVWHVRAGSAMLC